LVLQNNIQGDYYLKNYLLNFCPLSKNFKDDLKSKLEFEEINLIDMRKDFPFGKKLRAIKGNLYIPFETNSGLVVHPILCILTFFTKSKIFLILPDLNYKRVSRLGIIFKSTKLFYDSTINVFASYRHFSKLKKLHSKEIKFKENSPKRLVYLKTNLSATKEIGGSVGHIAGVVNGFVKQGYDVDFFTVEQPQMLSEKVKFKPIKLSSFGFPGELNSYAYQDTFLKQITRKNKEEYSFIYQRLSSGNYLGVALSRKLNIPLIIEYNGSEVWIAQNWGKPKRFSKLALKAEEACLNNANLIVTISKVLENELISRGIPKGKIVMYPNCVDSKIFNNDRFTQEEKDNLRSQYQIDKDTILLTFVGTFGRWHGVDILAKTIKEMVVSHEEYLIKNKLHFLLVGDGLLMPELKKILDEKNYKKYFTLTGLVPQHIAPLYLAISNILLSPHVANKDGSKFFGSPTKIFEYLAMNKAIIASDLDQIGEVLKNSLKPDEFASPDIDKKPISVLVAPGSVEQLINSIKFLVENEDIRKKLGGFAREEALEKYTWEIHVEKILEKIG